MSFFSRLLQPPPYLNIPIFALDISDRSFKYIQFEKTPHGRRVRAFGSGTFPAGLVQSGVITDTSKLAALLREQLSATAFRYVALALPEEKGFVRSIRIPEVAPEELREVIALQLEEYVPLPPEETSFVYHVLPEILPSTMDVLIAAYPTQLITMYRDAMDQAGYIPVSLEIESQAIARSVIPTAEEKDAVLVIDIGLTRTSFLFAKNGYTQLTSTIPIGGNTMHESIMNTLHVPEAEAERLKKEYGMGRTKEGRQVYEALLPLITSLQNEIQQRIEFWQKETHKEANTRDTPKLNHIYLCGREANLIGLPPLLSTQLQIPVSLPNVWINALPNQRVLPEIEFRDSLGYATSIGLAIGAEE
ncbi:MAG: hypothetical protein A3J54_00790 [Candidatus Ryanbacteria bacterium RIFCSPHIGHO2_02_FULL_45_13b]|uniref:SHS2 domain-containing protein n=1 Tax=Candidatus Ryanbacteria bacterium RIFCSPHIGHO2_02_FULL_45_13b TaxID=1802117 RepID=A0A1G2G5Q4_9BACT|nr:MAG: hypothetical protein A3J54_00790 [Candidatus Ryanbacteria bacterium RIFCSPHIGHO2_02_FULL_45_13b]